MQFHESQYSPAERGFHESINDALSKDVEPVTDWTDCAPFCLTPNFPTVTTSDSMIIEDLASDILAETGAATSSSQLFPIALAIKTEEDGGAPVRLKTIQLRTKNKLYIFDVKLIFSTGMCIEVLHSCRLQLLHRLAISYLRCAQSSPTHPSLRSDTPFARHSTQFRRSSLCLNLETS